MLLRHWSVTPVGACPLGSLAPTVGVEHVLTIMQDHFSQSERYCKRCSLRAADQAYQRATTILKATYIGDIDLRSPSLDATWSICILVGTSVRIAVVNSLPPSVHLDFW